MKGLFLSIDSLISLIAVGLALTLLVSPHQTIDPEMEKTALAWHHTTDHAMMGTYLQKPAADYLLQENNSTYAAKNYWKCQIVYWPKDFSAIGFNNQPDITDKNYCEAR